jgi:hypothetical protein
MPYTLTEGPRPLSETEKCDGTRAVFHVFYRKPNGKLYFDPSWEMTPHAAITGIERLLRGKGEVVRCHRITEAA